MKILGSIVFALLLFAGPIQAAEIKIGYLDIRQAIATSDAGKAASSQLQTKFIKFQEQAAAKQKELNSLKDELEKQGMALNETSKAAKLKEYQQKQRDFERFVKDSEEELKKTEMELINKIQTDIIKQVREYGKKSGFMLIVEAQEAGAIYADKSIDVTDAILKELNAQFNKK